MLRSKYCTFFKIAFFSHLRKFFYFYLLVQIYGRVGHLNFTELKNWFNKTGRDKISHIVVFELFFQRPTFPFILGMTGGDIEPEMTDPPEIPHFFDLRISLGSTFS